MSAAGGEARALLAAAIAAREIAGVIARITRSVRPAAAIVTSRLDDRGFGLGFKV